MHLDFRKYTPLPFQAVMCMWQVLKMRWEINASQNIGRMVSLFPLPMVQKMLWPIQLQFQEMMYMWPEMRVIRARYWKNNIAVNFKDSLKSGYANSITITNQ